MTDKILCPYCGAEMKPKGIVMYETRNDEHPRYVGECWCSGDGCESSGPCVQGKDKKGFATREEAIEAARAAALRRYTPPAKPLTLEEVWKEEDPVWVEGKNGALYIGDFYVSMSAKNGWDVQTLGSAKSWLLLEDYYGKTWRCWERKPTDEERSAAEWITD